jgi:hypothetical protein
MTVPASLAGLTIEVGLNGDPITYLQMRMLFIRAQSHYFRSQLVAEYPGIGKKGLIPTVGMVVRSTNPHPLDSHQSFVRKHFV